ncbi:MAG: hypothetical protein H7332_15645 [Bdellovibrionales bacterium]|nr:hypothetical protein [Ramlibacter sp.]
MEPLATPLGVWLGNQRNPATRLRLQVGSDGQSLNVLKIDIGIHGSTEFNVKTSFKVKSTQGNILNALAQDFDLESENANDLLHELADRTDVPQMLRWIGANEDVEVHANARPPTRQGKKEAALREPFVRALKVQARRVQVEARKHESPDLYMSEEAVHAATIDPQLERVRKDLLGLSVLGE